MTLSRLLLLGLLALLCWPTLADAQHSRRDRAEQRIRDECGDDRACAQRMRDEMRQQRQGDPTPAADPPERTRAQAAFDALPPDVQREMLERCKDDRACLRQAMRRYRQQTGDAPAPPPPTADSPALRTGETTPVRTRVPVGRTGTDAETPLRTPTSAGTPAPPPPAGAGQQFPARGSGGPVITTDRPRGQFPPRANDDPIATPDPSAPTETYFFYGSTDPTDLSGDGGHTVITKEPGNGAFLVGIESEEESDIPCGWRFLWYRDNDSDTAQGYFTTRGGDCVSTVNWNDTWGTRSHENATIDRILSPTDDDVRAVRSLQVCMNRDGDRIKGVRVWGGHVDTEGRVSGDDNLYGSFARSNCNDWSTKRTCATGEVAVGIKVEFGDAHDMIGGNSDNNASGMRLVCADPYTETD